MRKANFFIAIVFASIVTASLFAGGESSGGGCRGERVRRRFSDPGWRGQWRLELIRTKSTAGPIVIEYDAFLLGRDC